MGIFNEFNRTIWPKWHFRSRFSILGQAPRLDAPLLTAIVLLVILGLVTLFSAGGMDSDMMIRQGLRLGIGLSVMFLLVRVSADTLRLCSPWIYLLALLLLIGVMIVGEGGKGAQRWLDLGVLRFQPSELMKLAVPMVLAWYFSDKHLPPNLLRTALASLLAIIPAVLIAIQPDLGTALLVVCSGLFVVFLAGISWRLILALILVTSASAPLFWRMLYDYQQQRILTMINPENDPLGSGYHIIQAKIAVGSGGIYGKGWLNGTQSQLDFLPERSTDFIFAVYGEEFGFIGTVGLLSLYAFIVMRGLYLAACAQDTYSRLLAGSLSLSFFVYFFVNIGMVSGLLPVVGVPLPLMSYGGTSVVTLMATFGILMSVHSHRWLLAH